MARCSSAVLLSMTAPPTPVRSSHPYPLTSRPTATFCHCNGARRPIATAGKSGRGELGRRPKTLTDTAPSPLACGLQPLPRRKPGRRRLRLGRAADQAPFAQIGRYAVWAFPQHYDVSSPSFVWVLYVPVISVVCLWLRRLDRGVLRFVSGRGVV